MTKERIQVEVTDDTCSDDEAIIMQVPMDTMKGAIMEAVEVLFPTCRSIYIHIVEVQDDSIGAD